MNVDQRRMAQHQLAFFIGLFSMIAVVLLVALALYIFPNLFFGWNYDIHEHISHTIEWGEDVLEMSRDGVILLIYGVLVGLIMLFSWVGRAANRTIERDLLPMASPTDMPVKELTEDEALAEEEKASFWPFLTKVLFMFLLGAVITIMVHMWFSVEN